MDRSKFRTITTMMIEQLLRKLKGHIGKHEGGMAFSLGYLDTENLQD
jgi:hypothetical protein